MVTLAKKHFKPEVLSWKDFYYYFLHFSNNGANVIMPPNKKKICIKKSGVVVRPNDIKKFVDLFTSLSSSKLQNVLLRINRVHWTTSNNKNQTLTNFQAENVFHYLNDNYCVGFWIFPWSFCCSSIPHSVALVAHLPVFLIKIMFDIKLLGRWANCDILWLSENSRMAWPINSCTPLFLR